MIQAILSPIFTANMAPVSWTTQEQASFLQSHMSEYLTHTEGKAYHRFWANLNVAWFAAWPERAARLPSVEGPLTTEQEAALGKAIETRKNASLENGHIQRFTTYQFILDSNYECGFVGVPMVCAGPRFRKKRCQHSKRR